MDAARSLPPPSTAAGGAASAASRLGRAAGAPVGGFLPADARDGKGTPAVPDAAAADAAGGDAGEEESAAAAGASPMPPAAAKPRLAPLGDDAPKPPPVSAPKPLTPKPLPPRRTEPPPPSRLGPPPPPPPVPPPDAPPAFARFEVAVYVADFLNVDLFQQGWYAIRLSVAGTTGAPAAPSETGAATTNASDAGELAYTGRPTRVLGDVKTKHALSTIVGDTTVSVRPVRIKYTHESHTIDEMACFELAMPVSDAGAWRRARATVKVELLFCPLEGAEEGGNGKPREGCDVDALEVVATARLRLNRIADGVHAYHSMHYDEWHFARTHLLFHAGPIGARGATHADLEAAAKARTKALGAAASPRSKPGIPASPLAFFSRRSTAYAPSPAPAGGGTPRSPRASDGDSDDVGRRDSDPATLRIAIDSLVSSTSGMAAYLSALPPAVYGEAAMTAASAAGAAHDIHVGITAGSGGDPATPVPPHRLRQCLRDVSECASNAWKAFLAAHEQGAAASLAYHQQLWAQNHNDQWGALALPVHCLQELESSATEVLYPAHASASQRRRAAVAERRLQLSRAPPQPLPVEDMHVFENLEEQPLVCIEQSIISPDEASSTPRTESTSEVQLLISGSGGVGGSDASLRRVPSSSDLGGNHQGHLVVFVHGFQGAPTDLRLIRNHLQCSLPGLECLMSKSNKGRTYDAIDDMGSRLAEEVLEYVATKFKSGASRLLRRISFVGHSIGNVIIRAAVCGGEFEPLREYLGFFMSVSGPHLGYLFSTNTLFDGGMWLLKNVRRSKSLHQIALTDSRDLRGCYMYQLAHRFSLPQLFRHVILVSSPQDRYVPYHSARVETCAQQSGTVDAKGGKGRARVLGEMRKVLMEPHGYRPCTVTRCDVHYSAPKKLTLDRIVGRAAHIDFLETDVWIQLVVRLVLRACVSEL